MLAGIRGRGAPWRGGHGKTRATRELLQPQAGGSKRSPWKVNVRPLRDPPAAPGTLAPCGGERASRTEQRQTSLWEDGQQAQGTRPQDAPLDGGHPPADMSLSSQGASGGHLAAWPAALRGGTSEGHRRARVLLTQKTGCWDSPRSRKHRATVGTTCGRATASPWLSPCPRRQPPGCCRAGLWPSAARSCPAFSVLPGHP